MGKILGIIVGIVLIVVSIVIPGAFLATTLSKILFNIGLSLTLGGVSAALVRKPSNQTLLNPAGRQVTNRAAAASRVWVYGRQRIGGTVTWIDTAGEDNNFLYILVTLTGHMIKSVDNILFDNVVATVDWDDAHLNATGSGVYSGFLTAQVKTGEDGQTAMENLISDEPTVWDTDHRQRSCAQIYLKLKLDATAFPNGAPALSFDVHGKMVWDVRIDPVFPITYSLRAMDGDPISVYAPGHGRTTGDRVRITKNTACYSTGAQSGEWSITVIDSDYFSLDGSEYVVLVAGGTVDGGFIRRLDYSENGALIGNDYLSSERLRGGVGADYDAGEVNEPVLVAAANICDGSGFLVNGSFDLTSPPADIIPRIAGAIGGFIMPVSGQWNIVPYAPREATIELTDDDVIGDMQVTFWRSARDLFNGVKGTFIDPVNAWQETSFTPVSNAQALYQDKNEAVWKDVFFPFTIVQGTAEQLAQLDLARNRAQIQIQAPFKLRAYKAQPGSVIKLTHPRYGWDRKEFDVTDSSLQVVDDQDKGKSIAVVLSLAETPVACSVAAVGPYDSDVYLFSPPAPILVTTADLEGVTADLGFVLINARSMGNRFIYTLEDVDPLLAAAATEVFQFNTVTEEFGEDNDHPGTEGSWDFDAFDLTMFGIYGDWMGILAAPGSYSLTLVLTDPITGNVCRIPITIVNPDAETCDTPTVTSAEVAHEAVGIPGDQFSQSIGQKVIVRVKGTNFVPGCVVRLKRSGVSDTVLPARLVSPTEFLAVMELDQPSYAEWYYSDTRTHNPVKTDGQIFTIYVQGCAVSNEIKMYNQWDSITGAAADGSIPPDCSSFGDSAYGWQKYDDLAANPPIVTSPSCSRGATDNTILRNLMGNNAEPGPRLSTVQSKFNTDTANGNVRTGVYSNSATESDTSVQGLEIDADASFTLEFDQFGYLFGSAPFTGDDAVRGQTRFGLIESASKGDAPPVGGFFEIDTNDAPAGALDDSFPGNPMNWHMITTWRFVRPDGTRVDLGIIIPGVNTGPSPRIIMSHQTGDDQIWLFIEGNPIAHTDWYTPGSGPNMRVFGESKFDTESTTATNPSWSTFLPQVRSIAFP